MQNFVPIGQTVAEIWPFLYFVFEFWGFTLTFNAQRAMVTTHTRANIKVKGQLVQKIEWK